MGFPDATRDRAAAPQAERRFYGGMILAIALTLVAGFGRSYLLRPLLGPPANPPAAHHLTPLIHLHAALSAAWIAVLLTQARLVAGRRIDRHRKLGWLGGALALAMLPVGVITALHGVVRGVSVAGIEPRRFLALPLFAILVFFVLVAFAFAKRRSPQAHKRLMLLATLALLPPALARLMILELGLGSPAVVFAVVVAYVAALVVWDLRTLGRLHPATLWGGLFLVLSGPFRLLLSRTDAWLAFVDWAVRTLI